MDPGDDWPCLGFMRVKLLRIVIILAIVISLDGPSLSVVSG